MKAATLGLLAALWANAAWAQPTVTTELNPFAGPSADLPLPSGSPPGAPALPPGHRPLPAPSASGQAVSDTRRSVETTDKRDAALRAKRRACRQDQVVWVNAASRVYHREGAQHFGTTRNGRFLCESIAASEGYRPAASR